MALSGGLPEVEGYTFLLYNEFSRRHNILKACFVLLRSWPLDKEVILSRLLNPPTL